MLYSSQFLTCTHSPYSKYDDGVISSPLRAHRQQLQQNLLSELFKAYASESQDIGSIGVLSDVAESSGVMGKQETMQFLEGKELTEEVKIMAETAKVSGIPGVPVTILNNKGLICGAQEANTFIKVPCLFSLSRIA